LQVSPDSGLNPDDIRARRRRFGPNRLSIKAKRPAAAILLDQIKNLPDSASSL
jgi:hypothetical protein